ncbi:MAG TPA: M48 family metallopeptidase [Sedimentisphaerales bacterium]|nr:M48 family metallopeptidase [Sedimentisphaerales bacterium]
MCKKLGLLLLCVVSCFSAGCALNPITGEQELMFFPPEQDIEIGRQYAPEVEKELGGRIANESLQNYVDSVGQRIARVSHQPNLQYHFVALEHKSVNAFALPGGYLFITRGMLEKLETEAQLASVLAHEVVHVVARDTTNQMSNEIGMGLLLAAAASATTSRSVSTVAGLTRQILSLQYSQKDEREADLGGLDYMVRAGYNPYGAVETMHILERQHGTSPIEFFATHPSPQNRIGYLTRRIQTKYDNVSGLRVAREDYGRYVLEPLSRQPGSP